MFRDVILIRNTYQLCTKKTWIALFDVYNPKVQTYDIFLVGFYVDMGAQIFMMNAIFMGFFLKSFILG